MRWPWARGALGAVRTRTAGASVLVVGLVLAVAGLVLVSVLRDSLTDTVRTAARLRAEDLAEELERGTAPADLGLEAEDDLVVQVLDERGGVVTSSPGLDGERPLDEPRPGRSREIAGIDPGPGPAQDFLVVGEQADVAGGKLMVLVGRSLEPVDESTRVVTGLLLAGVPLLLVVVGITGWLLAGRALAPVEAIRSEVESISATELHRRVPDPSGHDEVSRLAGTMNDMLDRLDAAQDRQRGLIADAAHELRNPVATIRQHAEVARAHPRETTVPELAETVLAEDLRLERLVDDLLWLARADERGPRPRLVPLDLDELVEEEAARLAATTQVGINSDGVEPAQILGDREQLRHLLRNLGDNAARHARGAVAFSVLEDGVDVVLAVDDDGPGIPPVDRERVFERFTRLDGARSRDAGGAGLGLAIVAEIVAAHGGRVRATDSSLGGARFEARIPAPEGR